MIGDRRRRRRAFAPVLGGALEVRQVPSAPGAAAHHVAPAMAGGQPRVHATAAVAPTARRWAWLAGTYWCVPASNVHATLFSPSTNTLAPVIDQTVFQITGYRDGYFWGRTAAQIGSGSPGPSSMIGSVTPEGRVVLTFTSEGGSSGATLTEGFGQMRRKFGRWTMENQMFTAPSQSIQLGHWAYMVPTRPGMESWDALPGVGVPVPTFLAEAGGTAPQPVVG